MWSLFLIEHLHCSGIVCTTSIQVPDNSHVSVKEQCELFILWWTHVLFSDMGHVFSDDGKACCKEQTPKKPHVTTRLDHVLDVYVLLEVHH